MLQAIDRVTYLGKIYYNGETIDGQHEAIIDEDTWMKVQMERKKRSTKNAVTSSYLLTGLIFCGKCGARMRYQQWGKNGLKIYCYSQQTSKKNMIKDADCNNKKVDACDIEDIVLNDLFRRTENITGVNKKITFQTSAINVLKQKYEAVSNKIKRLYNLYAMEGDELLLETINENKSELMSIAEKIEYEEQSRKLVDEVSQANDMIRNLKNTWNTMTIHQKRRALRICIERIEIDDDDINIVYNF